MSYSILSNSYDTYFRDYLVDLLGKSDSGFIYSMINSMYVTFVVVGLSLLSLSRGIFFDCFSMLYKHDVYSYFVTPIIEVIYNVHREYYIIMTAIFAVILYIICVELHLCRDIYNRYSVLNSFMLELLWSIIPSIIILHFMMMTIALLYVSDEHPFFGFHIKVIGHQWYWEYETIRCFSSVESIYTNLSEVCMPEFCSKYNIFEQSSMGVKKPLDSMFRDETLRNISMYTSMQHIVKFGNFVEYNAERLLDTEGVLYLPYRIHIKLLVTSMDVIHAFTVPSLGIKADAIPGRLNDLHFFLTDNSAMIHYFGQCSELCGVGHAFMPIHVISI